MIYQLECAIIALSVSAFGTGVRMNATTIAVQRGRQSMHECNMRLHYPKPFRTNEMCPENRIFAFLKFRMMSLP